MLGAAVNLERLDPDGTARATTGTIGRFEVLGDCGQLLGEGRPDTVARRHTTGHRTARENVADLVEDGSFVEYGALAVAAQKGPTLDGGPDRERTCRRHGDRARPDQR